jgi:alkylation response protein AidB-like acyl-CoA dehydrogenase
VLNSGVPPLDEVVALAKNFANDVLRRVFAAAVRASGGYGLDAALGEGLGGSSTNRSFAFAIYDVK